VSSSSDVDGVLRTTFANLAKLNAATVDLNVQVTPRGAAAAQGPVGARVQGPFVSQGENKLPKFSLLSTMTSGGKTVAAGATWTGSKGFVSLQGTDYEVAGAAMRQLEAAYEQTTQARKGAAAGLLVGVDFTKWLRNPRNLGTEQFDGVDVAKVSGDADVARVMSDLSQIGAGMQSLGVPGAGGPLPGQMSPEARQKLVKAVKSMTVTVFTGADDQILRRLVVNADVKDDTSKADAALVMDLKFTKVGADQSIPTPEHAKPFSELMKALGGSGLGDLGGLLGARSDSSSSSGGSNNVDRFAACVQQAGGDAAKARRCASLLSG
jgi:hypothetical protein